MPDNAEIGTSTALIAASCLFPVLPRCDSCRPCLGHLGLLSPDCSGVHETGVGNSNLRFGALVWVRLGAMHQRWGIFENRILPDWFAISALALAFLSEVAAWVATKWEPRRPCCPNFVPSLINQSSTLVKGGAPSSYGCRAVSCVMVTAADKPI